jgi:hypothetical protein
LAKSARLNSDGRRISQPGSTDVTDGLSGHRGGNMLAGQLALIAAALFAGIGRRHAAYVRLKSFFAVMPSRFAVLP